MHEHRISRGRIQLDHTGGDRSAVEIIGAREDGISVRGAPRDEQPIGDYVRAAILVESEGAKVIRFKRYVIVRE